MATMEELQKQKDINSAKWHTAATQEEKDRLHQANIDLSKQMDALDGGSSSFDPTSGKWTRTPSATPAATLASDYVSRLQAEDRKQAAAEREATLAGLKGAYTKGIAAYDAQLDKLPERYRSAMNSAAAQSAMAKKAFDEQAAASGLNSGASGQAALDASAVYQGNLSNLQQSKASDMAEIDRAKADLTAQYETAIAKAKAEGDASLAKALRDSLILGTGWQREDEQIAYDRGRDTLADQRYDQEYTDRRADVAYSQKLQAAGTMAEFGNFNGYAELWGLDEATVNAMVAEYARQKQISEQQAALELEASGLSNDLLRKQIASYGKSTGGGGSVGSKSAGKPVLTWNQVQEAIEDGNLSPNVMSAYEHYMGVPYESDDSGVVASEQDMWNFKNSLAAAKKAGVSNDHFNNIVNAIWGKLSKTQQEEITRYITSTLGIQEKK